MIITVGGDFIFWGEDGYPRLVSSKVSYIYTITNPNWEVSDDAIIIRGYE